MHGTFPTSGATKTPVQALNPGNAKTASTPPNGKTTKPSDDPRTRAYVEG